MPDPEHRVAPVAPRAAQRPHVVASPWGNRVDEYYWLRDDERTAPDVLAHLAAENHYAEQVLAPLAPLERQLFDELSARIEPDESSVPVWRDGYWYASRFEAGQEYAIHVRRKGSLTAAEEIVLDENVLAAGREFFDLGDWTVSPDGGLVAYTEDTVGRRQYELAVRRIGDGTALADRVGNVEPEVVWAADSQTLLYVEKDPQTLLSVRVKAHRLGSAAAADRLIYEEADHSYYLGVGKSRSERFLLVACSSTEQSEWWYADSADPALRLQCVLPREAGHEYEPDHLPGHAGDEWILRSNWRAPNFRIVRAALGAAADRQAWRDVLPHRPDVFVEDFEVGLDHLAINERAGGLLQIRIRDWRHGSDGAADRVLAPLEGSGAMHLMATPDIASPRIRYAYSSLATPRTIYEYEPAAQRSQWRKTQAVLGGFDAARYATRLLMAEARDGARIPVSIAWRRDTPLDGSAAVFQYGYGAYGYSIDPDFRASWVSLMDRGFVVAIAHVRGGQELGRSWYDDGRLLRKHNTFTDFIDVTHMLVRERIGAPDRVCAQGGSAGGLLMGAIANLAPREYRAIVAHVPFVDVVTTMLDESIPLTTNEFDQWGDPRRRAEYEYLLSYSPYDNVRAQDYPALLVFTGLWDSQVQYFEPAKWVARLRERKTDTRPLLLAIDLNAGHGGKSGRYRRYRDTAREYAFLLWQIGQLPDVPPAVRGGS